MKPTKSLEPGHRAACVSVEQLEPRRLLSSDVTFTGYPPLPPPPVPASIHGTAKSDRIIVSLSSNPYEPGVRAVINGHVKLLPDYQIHIFANAGDDVVWIDPGFDNVPITIYGGGGNDTIYGNGSDHIFAGDGNDVVLCSDWNDT